MRAARALGAFCLSLTLAACAGGGAVPNLAHGGSATAPVPPQHEVRVPMHVHIPRMPRRARGRARRPYFVAASVQGIGVVVYPHGNHATPIGSTNADVSPSSPLCVASSGGRDCTVPIPAPPGDDDFVVTAYDAPPVGGSFAAAKQLAIGESTATIAVGAANAVAISLGGIVAGVSISPAQLFVHAIASSTQNLTVTAVDADGDAIVSDGYVNASGNPVSIALAADSAAGTTVSFAPSSLASPSPTGVTLSYASSNVTSAQVQHGFASTVTATAGAVSGSATLHASSPAATSYTTPPAFDQPQFVTTGPDKALWYTSLTSPSAAGRMTSGGAFSSSGALSQPGGGIAAGIDNAVWVTEGDGTIARVSVTSPGSPQEFAPPISMSFAAGVTGGPSDDAASMWYTDPIDGLIARIPTTSPSTGAIKVYGPVAGVLEPGGITAGPDGNLWFTDCTSGGIGKIAPTSPAGTAAQMTEFPIPPLGSGTASPTAIVAGPDGALWFADPVNGDNGEIGRITTSGAISEFAVASPAYELSVGPDGAIWFVQPTDNTLGRIDVKTHAILEFSTADLPAGVTLGPDNALYVTDQSTAVIQRYQ